MKVKEVRLGASRDWGETLNPKPVYVSGSLGAIAEALKADSPWLLLGSLA